MPDSTISAMERGLSALKAGAWAQAAACFQEVLSAMPDREDALGALATCYENLNDLAAAADIWERLLERHPGNPVFHDRAGIVAYRRRDLPAALACFDNALRISPDFPAALHHRAAILQPLRRYEEALTSFDHYFRVAKPIDPWAVYNHARALKDSGRMAAARKRYLDAMALLPDEATIGFGWGLLNLMQGDWRTGWKFYEQRWSGWDRVGVEAEPVSGLARWRGQDVARGSGLVVLAEQGLGDTVQFFRFQHALTERFGRVRMVVQPPLLRLLAGSAAAGVEVMTAREATQAGDTGFSHYIPMLSLPGALDIVPETVPHRTGYLSTPMATPGFPWLLEPARLRVGLVFQCGKVTGNPGRDLTPDAIEQLLQVPDIQWTILQNDVRLDHPRVFNIGGQVADFLDTAMVMQRLDLVITGDTAVAHVAGALGRPVWMYNRFESEWRWMHGRITSPWYSTMRIFSQASAGDWTSVIQEMIGCLSQCDFPNTHSNHSAARLR